MLRRGGDDNVFIRKGAVLAVPSTFQEPECFSSCDAVDPGAIDLRRVDMRELSCNQEQHVLQDVFCRVRIVENVLKISI